jgi:hypothetical protein
MQVRVDLELGKICESSANWNKTIRNLSQLNLKDYTWIINTIHSIWWRNPTARLWYHSYPFGLITLLWTLQISTFWYHWNRNCMLFLVVWSISFADNIASRWSLTWRCSCHISTIGTVNNKNILVLDDRDYSIVWTQYLYWWNRSTLSLDLDWIILSQFTNSCQE